MKKILLGTGLVVIVGLVAYAMKSNTTYAPTVDDATANDKITTDKKTDTMTADKNVNETTTPYDTAPETKTIPIDDAKDVVEVTVHASNFTFSTNTIRAKVGQKVRVILVNDNGFHDFVIDEFKTKGAMTKRIQGGQSETIAFTPDKKGSFEYYCSVGEHRAMGMKGTLIVE
jgi:plastocyanin